MINVKKSNLIAFKMGNSENADETMKLNIDNQVLKHKDTIYR